MKVSILTQPLGHNYGGLLQAYAMQVYLRKIGCEVETLDRRMPNNWVKWHILNMVRLALGKIKSLPSEKKKAFVFRHLERFRDRYIKLSKPIFTEKQLRKYYKKNHFDIALVGSDQVWRPRYSPSLFNFYLDFLDDVAPKIRRISYAASFGVDDWEYSPRETKICKDLIKKFDAISVRENSGVALCRDHFEVEAVCMADPTLLLDAYDYAQLISDADQIKTEGKTLCYFLDTSSQKEKIADKVAQMLGLKRYSIIPSNKMTEVTARDLALCQYLSVEQWLAGIKNAAFVVTDSFHGCVFSIIFNKPFIAVGNSARGLARFHSLLEDFGLTERLVMSDVSFNTNLTKTPINWCEVNRIREEKAEWSNRYLYSNIIEKVL